MTTVCADGWAIRIDLKNAARAGRLRAFRGAEAAIVGDDLWVKGPDLDEALLPVLSAIADGPVFTLSTKGLLSPVGSRVPVARLPNIEFTSAQNLFQPVLPSAAIPMGNVAKTQLRLVRGDSERSADLWLGRADLFRKWALTAPEIRLQRCRFAFGATDASRVMVRGNPLPPLDGQLFWLAGKVAIPLGWQWMPSIDIAAMNELVHSAATGSENAGESAIAMWQQESQGPNAQHVEWISGTSFVPATRSSVRRLPISPLS